MLLWNFPQLGSEAGRNLTVFDNAAAKKIHTVPLVL
jgi:hypothetical protein